MNTKRGRLVRFGLSEVKAIARRRKEDRPLKAVKLQAGRMLLGFVTVFIAMLNVVAVAAAQNGFDLSNATIPRNEILPGGPLRDGIPSIDHPQFVKPSQVNFLRDEGRVLSVKIDNEARAYPLRILDSHEIVNDQIGEQAIAVTYCPLAGAAIAFDRNVSGRKLSFGVSGLLYQSDLVMYDRETESLWPQVAMKAVSGAQAGAQLRWLPSEDMTWRTWRQAHPDGKVLSAEAGEYPGDPYQDYKRSSETMFPVQWSRSELPKKSWVIGVIVNGQGKAYSLDDLKNQTRVQDNVGGTQIEIAYDPANRSAEVIDKKSGQQIPFTLAYWFVWQAFYPKTELFRR
jgi:hypothetical protein